MSHNGSAIVAMVGKNCVAIAADRRYGIEGQVRKLLQNSFSAMRLRY